MMLQEQIEQTATKPKESTRNFSDFVSLALHQLVAVRLQSNPNLLQKAHANLQKWLKNNPNIPAWTEWKTILEKENLEDVVKIISAETDESQRLRSSSPFAGIISAEERNVIIQDCEKAKPF